MKRFALVLIVIGGAAYGAVLLYQQQLAQQDSSAPLHVFTLPSGFESFAASADSIRSLHEKKKPIRPGDWLDKFPEGGQSFAQYVIERRQKPLCEDFSTIYIQPLGEFDETERKIVAQTAEFMELYFGMKVEALDSRPLEEVPETARRTWNDTEQLLSTWVLDECLKPQRPDNAIAVIGLVTCDLWPGDLNWVFGSASLRDRVGVWSLFRNGDPHAGKAAYDICLKRTLKTAVHETGHMLGIPHCAEYECCMNGSRSRDESDRRPMEFCPECQPKIWWTCGADAKKRSRNLAEFATRNGMSNEAKIWTRHSERLAR